MFKKILLILVLGCSGTIISNMHDDQQHMLAAVMAVNSLTKVKQLVLEEKVPSSIVNYGLVMASRFGDEAVVKFLLNHGAKPNESNLFTKGTSALIEASKSNHPKIVGLLIKFDADVNLKRPVGTALSVAQQHGNLEIIKILKKAGAEDIIPVVPVIRDIQEDKINMVRAVIQSNLERIKQLVEEEQVHPGVINYGLVIASRAGDIEIVKFLLDHGANIDASDLLPEPTSALIEASKNNRPEVVEFLIKSNANVNIKDQSGTTALGYAQQKGYTDIVHMLEQAHAK